MKLIDTHTHLYLEHFDEDIDEVISRAVDAGVVNFFLPNIDSGSIQQVHALADKYPDRCFPMMGLHPCSIKEGWQEELSKIKEELFNGGRKYWAVGEIGLDYYWDTSFKEQQQEAFRQQIGWAVEKNLPIVIHNRDSFADAIAIVAEMKQQYPQLTGVFHCFTGTLEEAQQVIDLDFFLGIGGVATFKNGGLDKVFPHIPLKNVVLETDAPYLAPVPYRGKRNESSYIKYVAEKLAEFFSVPVEEVAVITTKNAEMLFKKSSQTV